MKKAVSLALTLLLALGALAACGGDDSTTPETTPEAGADNAATENAGGEAGDFNYGQEITVVSREDGSGTRGAFIELFGIEEKNEDGEKIDRTTPEALINSSTSVMMTTVAGDNAAIGYISLGSLNDSVKAVEIDGVAATVANIKDGSYSVSRPFNIALSATASEATQDFVDFILSAEGQAVVEDNGYIAFVDDAPAFEGGSATGTIVVSGSSSVSPVMEKLAEAYEAVNSGVSIDIQTSDSSTGMSDAISGNCDIGMASRELKDSETEAGLEPVVIALDGIAVIVNNENPVNGLTTDEVKSIFVGETYTWDFAA